MIVTFKAIAELRPPFNASKKLQTIYYIACGNTLTGDKASQLFGEVALHTTIDDIRGLGLEVKSQRISPHEPRHEYWVHNDPDILLQFYNYLVSQGCLSTQTHLFPELNTSSGIEITIDYLRAFTHTHPQNLCVYLVYCFAVGYCVRVAWGYNDDDTTTLDINSGTILASEINSIKNEFNFDIRYIDLEETTFLEDGRWCRIRQYYAPPTPPNLAKFHQALIKFGFKPSPETHDDSTPVSFS
ncbi:MAG: hypothetical protein P1U47_14870 [Zhongshania sp.]|uniref:hypothetical protein n=1 Tax=Zhongshania sp. TaxID=1971902 RepID=UPI00262EFC43|nr:hypothetical protein [Zhongshania sp.]MDF1693660.1 hypothetical protein [Zhongshania sp.]